MQRFKKATFLVVTCVLALIFGAFVAPSFAQNTSAISVYGYGRVTIPTQEDSTLGHDWVRAGIKGTLPENMYPNFIDGLMGVIEYDFDSAGTVQSYVRAEKNIAGGTLALQVGRQFAPSQNYTPFAYELPLGVGIGGENWVAATNPFTYIADQIAVHYDRIMNEQPIAVRYAYLGNNIHTATASYRTGALIYEKGKGYGAIVSSPWEKWWFHPYAAAFLAQNRELGEIYSIRNNFTIATGLDIYGKYDWSGEQGDGPDNITLGVVCTYARNSRLVFAYTSEPANFGDTHSRKFYSTMSYTFGNP